MSIEGNVSGDREVIRRFEALGPSLREELIRAVGRITLRLMRRSVQDKLSGQVLKRRTGTLARSVTQSPRTYEAGQRIVGTVGISDITGRGGRRPVKYGRVHEFGFDGPVSVKEHLRRVKQAFGRPLKSPVQATVRAHSKHMKLPVRSFLATALRDLDQSGFIKAEFDRAAEAAAKAAK